MYLTEVCLYKCGNICQSVSVMFIQMQLATAEIYTGVVRSGKSSALQQSETAWTACFQTICKEVEFNQRKMCPYIASRYNQRSECWAWE